MVQTFSIELIVNLMLKLIKSDLNAFYEWCTNNNFTLNINKCQLMSFSRARVVPNFNYFINTEMLHRSMEPVKDFGILFNPKL